MRRASYHHAMTVNPNKVESQMPDSNDEVEVLAEFISRHRSLFVLTGAGCSTQSGIPDYRDAKGEWKHSQPVQYQDFVNREKSRRRYWSRSMLGWPRVQAAEPNAAHNALVRLERAGFVEQLVTQNVDGLHQRAGSEGVIDLHGNLKLTFCIDCGFELSREELQLELEKNNPMPLAKSSVTLPDGDVQLGKEELENFHVPPCPRCAGILKPAVVFFGEPVPKKRVDHARSALHQASAMLVVGSSLMVYSGYRFCRWAVEQGKPIASVNVGRTRADGEISLKLEQDCGTSLSKLADLLGA